MQQQHQRDRIEWILERVRAIIHTSPLANVRSHFFFGSCVKETCVDCEWPDIDVLLEVAVATHETGPASQFLLRYFHLLSGHFPSLTLTFPRLRLTFRQSSRETAFHLDLIFAVRLDTVDDEDTRHLFGYTRTVTPRAFHHFYAIALESGWVATHPLIDTDIMRRVSPALRTAVCTVKRIVSHVEPRLTLPGYWVECVAVNDQLTRPHELLWRLVAALECGDLRDMYIPEKNLIVSPVQSALTATRLREWCTKRLPMKAHL